MKHYTYESNYGTTYEDCIFHVDRYRDNDNLAITMISETEGPVMKITVNPEVKIPDGYIAIKNYSENEGIDEWLISMDIIDQHPATVLYNGYVMIPVYRITDNGKEILGLE